MLRDNVSIGANAIRLEILVDTTSRVSLFCGVINMRKTYGVEDKKGTCFLTVNVEMNPHRHTLFLLKTGSLESPLAGVTRRQSLGNATTKYAINGIDLGSDNLHLITGEDTSLAAPESAGTGSIPRSLVPRSRSGSQEEVEASIELLQGLDLGNAASESGLCLKETTASERASWLKGCSQSHQTRNESVPSESSEPSDSPICMELLHMFLSSEIDYGTVPERNDMYHESWCVSELVQPETRLYLSSAMLSGYLDLEQEMESGGVSDIAVAAEIEAQVEIGSDLEYASETKSKSVDIAECECLPESDIDSEYEPVQNHALDKENSYLPAAVVTTAIGAYPDKLRAKVVDNSNIAIKPMGANYDYKNADRPTSRYSQVILHRDRTIVTINYDPTKYPLLHTSVPLIPMEVLKQTYPKCDTLSHDSAKQPSSSKRLKFKFTDEQLQDHYYARLNKYTLLEILELDAYHVDLTVYVEKVVLEVFRDKCEYPLGYKRWVRDNLPHERCRLIHRLWHYTSGMFPDLTPFLLEVIIRKGSYSAMQGRLRREKRIRLRCSKPMA